MKHMAKLYGTTMYLGQVGTWVARRSVGWYRPLHESLRAGNDTCCAARLRTTAAPTYLNGTAREESLGLGCFEGHTCKAFKYYGQQGRYISISNSEPFLWKGVPGCSYLYIPMRINANSTLGIVCKKTIEITPSQRLFCYLFSPSKSSSLPISPFFFFLLG